MARKVFKPLGTLTPAAAALASPFLELNEDELRERVAVRRQQLIAEGEIDDLEDEQRDLAAPPLDDSLIGWRIEVRWRYWRPATEADRQKHKVQEYIWCEGEVVALTAAESVKINPKLKKEDIAGETAVRIRWPRDAERDEPEQCIWTVLKPADWCQQVHLGWRYAAASLQRLERERTPEKC